MSFDIDEIGSRKGFSHSKSCCRRYEDWLRTQVQGQDNIDPVVHDTLKEGLEECDHEPTKPGEPVEDSLESVGKEDGNVMVSDSESPKPRKPGTVRHAKVEWWRLGSGIARSVRETKKT